MDDKVKTAARGLLQSLAEQTGEEWRVRQDREGYHITRTVGGVVIRCTMPDGRMGWWTAEKSWTTDPGLARRYSRAGSAGSARRFIVADLDGVTVRHPHSRSFKGDVYDGWTQYNEHRSKFEIVAHGDTTPPWWVQPAESDAEPEPESGVTP